MEIKYVGHSSFIIKTKPAIIVTDPFDSTMVGIKYPKLEADILTISHGHNDHNQAQQVGGEPLIIDWPGEFEKNGVRIFGFSSYHDKNKGADRGENIIFKFEVEDMTLVHCGDLGHMPDEEIIDNLGNVDILFIPVGGHVTIDATEAEHIIKKVEPSIVIPMHYNHDKLNQSNFDKLTPLSEFLTKMGLDSVEPVEKLTVKAGDFEEQTKVVVMQI